MALTGQTAVQNIPENTPLLRGVMFRLPRPPCSYRCDEQRRMLALTTNQVARHICVVQFGWYHRSTACTPAPRCGAGVLFVIVTAPQKKL